MMRSVRLAFALLLLHAPAGLAQGPPLRPPAPFVVVQPQDPAGPATGSVPSPAPGTATAATPERPWPANQHPQTVVLTYSEPRAASGSAQERLLARLGQSTAELRVEAAPTASFTIVVTPRLYEPSVPYPDLVTTHYYSHVQVEVGTAELRIDPSTASDRRRLLMEEAQEVVRRLRLWVKPLERWEQTDLLYTDGLRVPLVGPFDHLVLLSKPRIDLTVGGRGQIRPEIAFVTDEPLTPGSSRSVAIGDIEVGKPFWVEAFYTAEQYRYIEDEIRRIGAKTARLTWDGGSLEVALREVAPLVFRSGPLYVTPLGEIETGAAAPGDGR